ncbi:MAG: DNA-processing protein DprA [Patescibacteria group bacterium]|nr:DNA-processing protein DprA [Patescibacteria group bacterium]
MTVEEYYLGFSCSYCIGPRRFAVLLSRFGDLESAYHAPVAELRTLFGARIAAHFELFRRKFLPSEIRKRCDAAEIRSLHREHPDYPSSLKHLSDPPLVVFIRGGERIPAEKDPSIAIVGTRRPTSYGRSLATDFSRELSRQGVPIVSGLAYGIDATAHTAALENSGVTIAVLGSGVDAPYPNGNISLANKIIEYGGILISEYPPGTPPRKFHFVQRNRIIAALSRGVLVVEGTASSGALITAEFALQLGREVYVAPMPLNSELSVAPNSLARNGATVVYDPSDILHDLGCVNISSPGAKFTGKEGTEMYRLRKVLLRQPATLTDLAAETGLPVSGLAVVLTEMELSGVVIRGSDGAYRAVT